MPTVPPAENTTYAKRIILPARLIPGIPLGGTSVRRAKISSAVLNKPAGWDDFHDVHAPQPPAWGRLMMETLLPTPGQSIQRLALVMQVVADFLLLAVGFALSSLLLALVTAATKLSPVQPIAPTTAKFGACLLTGTVFTLLGYSERLYHPEILRAPRQQVLVLLKVLLWSTVLVSIVLAPSREARTTLLAAPINFLVLLGYRENRRKAQGHAARDGSAVRNVLIVGASPLGRKLAQLFEKDPAAGRIVRGFLDEIQSADGKVLGRVSELVAVARKEFVDEIVIAVPQQSDLARQAIWQARRNHIDVKLIPDLLGADPAQARMETLGGLPLITLWEEPLPAFRLSLKRTADLFLSTTALLLSSPLLCAIALAIKLDSPGPALYCAPRVGLKGRRFRCYKFRTMIKNAEQLKEKLRGRNERAGAFFKMAEDPRITRVGKFLRRYSLDEMPQLWNVVRGEMSLVGPRPHPTDDVARYQLQDLQRLEVTPGLTGLWQVTARGDPSFAKSMALDREYIGKWSLASDLRILCRTVSAVLRGQGT